MVFSAHAQMEISVKDEAHCQEHMELIHRIECYLMYVCGIHSSYKAKD